MTKTKLNEWRLFALAALFAFLAGMVMASCASVPVNDYDSAPELVSDENTADLIITNDNFYDAVVSVDGARVVEMGTGKLTRPVRLGGGRCITVTIKLRMTFVTAQSTRECIRQGGHFELQIGPSSPLLPNPQIWLVPR